MGGLGLHGEFSGNKLYYQHNAREYAYILRVDLPDRLRGNPDAPYNSAFRWARTFLCNDQGPRDGSADLDALCKKLMNSGGDAKRIGQILKKDTDALELAMTMPAAIAALYDSLELLSLTALRRRIGTYVGKSVRQLCVFVRRFEQLIKRLEESGAEDEVIYETLRCRFLDKTSPDKLSVDRELSCGHLSVKAKYPPAFRAALDRLAALEARYRARARRPASLQPCRQP